MQRATNAANMSFSRKPSALLLQSHRALLALSTSTTINTALSPVFLSRSYAARPGKKKPAKQDKFPRKFRKYNVYGLETRESKRPRPPMTFTLPNVPKHFYKLRYFLFQIAQCKLTYDWEQILQISRNIQRYQGEPGMPTKINPVVFNWICIALIRCGKPVEAIEVWRGMRNRDNGIFGAAVRELRKQKKRD